MIDPRALSAVSAYESFSDAANEAERHPSKKGRPWPPRGDFTKFSFDPIQAQEKGYIWSLALDGTQFRGTPPQLNVEVKSIQLKAPSWPTVTLTDCGTRGSWHPYNAKTGKRLPETKPAVPPPYAATITVIYFQKRWGVRNIKLDVSRTCNA